MVALAVLGAFATIGFAFNLSSYIATVFSGRYATDETLLLVLALGGFKAALIWVQEWMGAAAGARAKSQLRQRLLAAIVKLGPSWIKTQNTSEISLLATKQLDSLDAYFAKFLPQLVFTALVTPAFTAVIFANDFWSGVAVICTLPLIPLFMIFIGWATQGVQQQQLDAMNRMSRHFGEVLRGLTTLKIFGRLSQQPAAIEKVSETYRTKTMKVLRVSFLSGFALEVAASLSVALIAVSIGLRLIDGTIALGTGLFILLLAPETYLPLRQVGAHFHASNEGVVASSRALDIVVEAEALVDARPSVNVGLFKPGSITQIVGASGAGKTTVLDHLHRAVGIANSALLPQRVGLLNQTVLENILAGRSLDQEILQRVVQIAQIDFDLDHPVGFEGRALSGGQAQRVGLARAVYRLLDTDCDWLLLDEPFSALNKALAAEIAVGLKRLARSGKTIVVVSHQIFSGVDAQVSVAEVISFEVSNA